MGAGDTISWVQSDRRTERKRPTGDHPLVKPDLQALWTQIEPILDGVLDLPEHSRPDYLDQACSGSPSLRAAVE